MYVCHYPAPQPPQPQELSGASPSPLQPLDLYTVVSHLSEEEQNLPVLQKNLNHRDVSLGSAELRTHYTSGNEVPNFLGLPRKFHSKWVIREMMTEKGAQHTFPPHSAGASAAGASPDPDDSAPPSPRWVLFMFCGWQFVSCSFYYTFSSKYTADDTTRREMLLSSPPRISGPLFYGIINVYGVCR